MQLSLISPECVVFAGDVKMIVIPGAKGEFGVLDHHAPFMTMLREGPVTLYEKKDKKSQVFTISGGFCEVTPDGCIVLADSVETAVK
jgi:F-type H+-transporting ATPase subunit epsilon